MNDFNKIISAEQSREYVLTNRDQFVFDTLTEIQTRKTIKLKRLSLLLVSVLLIVAVIVQILFLQAASFSNLGSMLQQFLTQKPYYLALFNLSVIGLILAIRRLRIFA